jgi:metal-responsive CopG/Arc/MetJ family transcriptional regulator
MAQTQRTVALKSNQQQLELVDKTIKRTGAASREDVVRQALREFVDHHGSRHDPKAG